MNLAKYATVLIVRLSIAGLPGVSKTDAGETKKLVDSKGTTKRHARVTKTLFSDSPRASNLRKLATEVRNYLRLVTLPGEVSGKYMIPAARFREIADKLNGYQKQYTGIVDDFIANLAGEIQLDRSGKNAMFDMSDYPTSTQIARHASFDWGFEPLPESSSFNGIFDSDAIARDYAEKHENHIQTMFVKATETNMNRIQDRLDKAINTLTVYTGAKGQKLRCNDLIEGMEKDGKEALALNVANDSEVARLGQAMIDFANSYPVPDNLKVEDIRAKALAELVALSPLGAKPVAPAVQTLPEVAEAVQEQVTDVAPEAAPAETNVFAMDF